MSSNDLAVCVIAILWLGSGELYGGSNDAKNATTPQASVTVHLTPEGTDEGLRLIYPTQISASSARPVDFRFLVVNLLKEEIFLEVTGYDDLRYEVSNVVENEDMPPLEAGSGGGSVVGSPNNSQLLKRLHACSYFKDSKPHPCGCAMAVIVAKIDLNKELNLKEHVDSKMTVGVSLIGYYRATGKQFQATANLAVKIVK